MNIISVEVKTGVCLSNYMQFVIDVYKSYGISEWFLELVGTELTKLGVQFEDSSSRKQQVDIVVEDEKLRHTTCVRCSRKI